MADLWGFQVSVLPGSPAADRLLPVFRLLVGDGGLLDRPRLESTELDMADPAAYLAESYPEYQSRSEGGLNLQIEGPGDAFVSVDFSLGPRRGGTLAGHLPGVDGDHLVDAVSTIVDQLEALFASVYAGEYEATMPARVAAHREATKAAHGRDAFPFWVRWGLPGLAWRSMLGGPFVELIGEDRLRAASDDDLAWPVGAHWVVAGSSAPGDWSLEPMGDQERRAIDLLGPEYFFDIDTGRLPTRLPDLPSTPSFAVTLHDGERPPTVDPVPPPPDRPDFAARAAWVVQQMSELVPEFESDDQLFWVEESLRDRPADQHDYLVDHYGAWLGEYVRAAVDGEWVETADGWVVADPSGGEHDPYGQLRRHLEDNSALLKPWVRSIVDGDRP